VDRHRADLRGRRAAARERSRIRAELSQVLHLYSWPNVGHLSCLPPAHPPQGRNFRPVGVAPPRGGCVPRLQVCRRHQLRARPRIRYGQRGALVCGGVDPLILFTLGCIKSRNLLRGPLDFFQHSPTTTTNIISSTTYLCQVQLMPTWNPFIAVGVQLHYAPPPTGDLRAYLEVHRVTDWLRDVFCF